MPFQANPRRDAHATIAGFFYQANITLLRWMALQPGQHLELEAGEDIDTVEPADSDPASAERRLLEQLKVRSTKSVTLRSPEALEALSNFCEHRASNPDSELQFRYLTTAAAGVEQGWTLPEGGIETWIELRRGGYDEELRSKALGEIRRFLKLGNQPERVSQKAWGACVAKYSPGCDRGSGEPADRFADSIPCSGGQWSFTPGALFGRGVEYPGCSHCD